MWIPLDPSLLSGIQQAPWDTQRHEKLGRDLSESTLDLRSCHLPQQPAMLRSLPVRPSLLVALSMEPPLPPPMLDCLDYPNPLPSALMLVNRNPPPSALMLANPNLAPSGLMLDNPNPLLLALMLDSHNPKHSGHPLSILMI